MTIWLAGRTDYGRTDYDANDKESMRWELLGLYSDHDKAVTRCKKQFDFVVPIELNRDCPEETVTFEATEWPLNK